MARPLGDWSSSCAPAAHDESCWARDAGRRVPQECHVKHDPLSRFVRSWRAAASIATAAYMQRARGGAWPPASRAAP
jgi:hypothetical protein